MDRAQSWSRGCAPGCSAEIWFRVPYRPGIQTGSRVLDCAWRNKFLVPKYFCAHLRNLTHSNPPLPLVLKNTLCTRNTPPTTDGRDITHRYRPRQGLWCKNQAISRGSRRRWRIITGIWRKKKEFGREKKTRYTHISYNPLASFNVLADK